MKNLVVSCSWGRNFRPNVSLATMTPPSSPADRPRLDSRSLCCRQLWMLGPGLLGAVLAGRSSFGAWGKQKRCVVGVKVHSKIWEGEAQSSSIILFEDQVKTPVLRQFLGGDYVSGQSERSFVWEKPPPDSLPHSAPGPPPSAAQSPCNQHTEVLES